MDKLLICVHLCSPRARESTKCNNSNNNKNNIKNKKSNNNKKVRENVHAGNGEEELEMGQQKEKTANNNKEYMCVD